MIRVLLDNDADLKYLQGKTVGIIGYGNQGRAQALNLRDSGLRVIIGSIRDAGADQAQSEGFQIVSIPEAVEMSDVLALLIPDEVQREVYHSQIHGKLRPGQVLDFAHGYNIHFRLIQPPKQVDVIMVAPRMIGITVRKTFEKGRGAPAYVAVAADASGKARDIALAFAKGIGATRAGVLETTFAHETELDLFAEQGVWPIIMRDLLLSYEVLVEAGIPPEMVALELYGSGEAAEIFSQMARVGIFNQMKFHSQTSQYGTLSRGPRMLPDEIKDKLRSTLKEIQSGKFANEWEKEQELGYPNFKQLRQRAKEHSINRVEETVRAILFRSGLGED